MKSPAAILIVCVLISHVEGMAILIPSGRCLCIDAGVNFIKPANIEKIEVHSPSFSCQKMEIIVTMKNGEEKKCLNPESKFAKNFIKNSLRQKRSLKTTGA